MTPPDLSTPEGRALYRRELQGVARPLRHTGAMFAVLGVVLALVRVVAVPGLPAAVPLGALALGLLNLLAAAALRTRYHLMRMRDD
ncbi:hypothetical protein [Sphingomonas aracearum]|uniref:hypothetical protein n=1 Tax=Sphingomonas aracearum TaxID=2283317 RepID=UPI0011C046B1|nr:hypothetical protein [Sphingomonas aracearum]